MTPTNTCGHGYNIATDNACAYSIQIMFQPEPEEPINYISPTATWEDIAVALGVFPSKGQARKNGWAGELPTGFNTRTTKKHGTIWLYKPNEWALNLGARHQRLANHNKLV